MEGSSGHAYAVVYRTGGREWCSWKRVLGRFSLEKANEHKADIERMGYFALIHDAKALDSIGLPIGWNAETKIDYVKDVVTFSRHETLHIVGGKKK